MFLKCLFFIFCYSYFWLNVAVLQQMVSLNQAEILKFGIDVMDTFNEIILTFFVMHLTLTDLYIDILIYHDSHICYLQTH